MKIALFPGTFDPVTIGHVEIVERALDLFDKVLVGIGINSSKNTFFTQDQRIELLKASFSKLKRVEVVGFEGLTSDYARLHGIGFLLRGLRDAKDLDYERPIALINRHLNADLETVFLISQPEYSHLSSTLVREVIRYGGKMEGLVPDECLERILKWRG